MTESRYYDSEFPEEAIFNIEDLDEMVESGEISPREEGFIRGCLEEEE